MKIFAVTKVAGSCFHSSYLKTFSYFVLGSIFVLFPALGLCRADLIVSTFEEQPLASNLNAQNAFQGLSNQSTTFTSGAVTFVNDGLFTYPGGSYWSGVGYSRRTQRDAAQLYENSNDMIAKPAVGANGSQTWAIATDGSKMTASSGYFFTSLSLTNTLYSWSSMALGDSFVKTPFSTSGATEPIAGQPDFYGVRFTNTATQAQLEIKLADYAVSNPYIVDSWMSFDISALKANEVSISFFGSRTTKFDNSPDPPIYLLATPAYVAMDNITVAAVPEPGSLALLGCAATAAYGFYRKRRAGSSNTSC